MIGGIQLALLKSHMQAILLSNGHLRMEGNETAEELRTALLYLRPHTIEKCWRPELGISIDALIPDISVLAPKFTKRRNVQNVATQNERL